MRVGLRWTSVALALLVLATIPTTTAVAEGTPHSAAPFTVLVLGSRVVMSPAQQQSARRVLDSRLRALGLPAARFVTHPHELVITVPSALTPQQQGEAAVTGKVFARPVSCFARGPVKGARVSVSSPPLVCGSKHLLSQNNLDVQPEPNSASGYSVRNVRADPAFDHRDSTTPDRETIGASALLSSIAGLGESRYLCSAGFSWSDAVTTTSVSRALGGGEWLVDLTFTKRGSAQLDRLSRETYHRYLAVELDGRIIVAALVEPVQSQWLSFNGTFEILTSSKSRAELISFALDHGALPVHVTLLRARTH
jgi:hypothetical protein